MRVVQTNLGAGILSEGMYAREDTQKFRQGLKDAVNVTIKTQGGVQNRAGLEAVTAFDTSGATASQYLLPFAFNSEQTYQLEFTDDKFRVIRNGGYVLDTSVGAVALSNITDAATAQLTLSDAADAASFNVGCLVYIEDPNGTHALHNTPVEITATSGATLSFKVFDGSTLDTSSDDWGDIGSGATLSKVYEQSHTYDLDDMSDVRSAQDADTIYLVHEDYPVRKLTRTAHDNWSLADVSFAQSIDPPTGLSATATQGPDVDAANLLTYEYKVSSVDEDDQESLPSASVSIDNDLYYERSKNNLSWTALDGAVRYNVYKEDAGGYGYIGTTTATSFSDENITADLAQGPKVGRNPFASEGNYPSQVSFYEQRLAFGATKNDPQLVEMSRAGTPENFSTSYPSKSDDAFRFRLRSQQVNRVAAFVPHETFTMLTSAAEWEIASQGDGEYVRPDRRRLSPISYHGSNGLNPILAGEVALYVEPSGNTIRDLRLRDRSQPPGDLTVLSRDLFDDKEIVSWAVSAAPDRIVWVVLDDGQLLSMTYVPEHDVWSWTRHIVAGTDAKVKQVSVTREGVRDVPYFVVSRQIGEQTVNMTERLAHRENKDVKKAYFLDGGFYAKFAQATSRVGGLLHLRGETVTVLVDGDEVTDLVVDATGTVSLSDYEGQNVSVGLPYDAWVQTLDVVFQIEGVGSSEGVFKSVSEVALKLEKSRGVSAGQSLDRMNELKEWDASLIGGPIPLRSHTPVVSVDGDWVRDATLYVLQTHALPFTLNSITPNWEVGG